MHCLHLWTINEKRGQVRASLICIAFSETLQVHGHSCGLSGANPYKKIIDRGQDLQRVKLTRMLELLLVLTEVKVHPAITQMELGLRKASSCQSCLLSPVTPETIKLSQTILFQLKSYSLTS